MHTLRAVVLSLLIVIVGVIAFNYMNGGVGFRGTQPERPVGAGGAVNVETARERGAEVGERVAVAAAKVKESAGEAALTSKIKAKMMLDDNIRSRAIDVTTEGSVVTLSGTVRSADEHDRAVRLTRETTGVTRVVDLLKVG